MSITLYLLLVGFIVVAYFTYTTFFATHKHDHHADSDEEKEEKLVVKEYTLEDLAKFNGTTDPKVYISLCGEVHDVSRGKTFYGPGGPYNCFAGKEAALGLAKGSFDDKFANAVTLNVEKDLKFSEREDLYGFMDTFQKYPVIGWLKEWMENHPQDMEKFTKEYLSSEDDKKSK